MEEFNKTTTFQTENKNFELNYHYAKQETDFSSYVTEHGFETDKGTGIVQTKGYEIEFVDWKVSKVSKGTTNETKNALAQKELNHYIQGNIKGNSTSDLNVIVGIKKETYAKIKKFFKEAVKERKEKHNQDQTKEKSIEANKKIKAKEKREKEIKAAYNNVNIGNIESQIVKRSKFEAKVKIKDTETDEEDEFIYRNIADVGTVVNPAYPIGVGAESGIYDKGYWISHNFEKNKWEKVREATEFEEKSLLYLALNPPVNPLFRDEEE